MHVTRYRDPSGRRLLALLASLLVVLAVRPAKAQQRDSVPADTIATDPVTPADSGRWLVGGTIMLPSSSESLDLSFAAIGLTATSLRPNRPGPDFAVVVVPRALGFGVVVGGVRANLSLPIAVSPGVWLVPSGGLTLLGALGSSGATGAHGLNGALALIVARRSAGAASSSVGLRVALSRHRFGDADHFTMLEAGFVRR
ncbi:MAG: hypothetical protein IT355_06520 [Gemmatimonadaceae bacterium]|nr:hypothetical protein [Gemmatimonadaceae bacterium]